MNALRVYARQSESLKKWRMQKWRKQKWRKDSEKTIYRAKGGDKWHLIIREWETQRIPTYRHIRAASVREISNNDDGWANSQMQRAFWGRINGYLNCPMPTHWASRIAFCPSYSLIRLREPNTYQEGANVRSCYTQAHLGLGFQPDNVAYTIPRPNSQATLKSLLGCTISRLPGNT